ncbi:uncharacterized protein LOC117501034 [Thalassophryne amazonica]|uniref:uncharacterized protein LOC117501034 n=1 Tax=Thalassophryne amazonica TaxID=390379 RepID=UPI0014721377|nr:uncharacterized protein LOC117501034 [Thalassophryne amazonica]XP_034015729.1 uncharacterized protein LOC117501034 [Thalassophryne amazonica]
MACVEYTGKYPDAAKPHGNSKPDDKFPYVRTDPAVLERIANADAKLGPNELYDLMTRDTDMQAVPRDPKQIKNKRYYEKRKQKMQSTSDTLVKINHGTHSDDDMQQLFSLIGSHPFVQGICGVVGSTPAVILYTEEQLHDLRRFCFSKSVAENTVLGIDKILNLTNFCVTTTSFKNLALIRRTTRDHPIFMGPMFIHGNSTQTDFTQFFSHLNSKLCDSPSPPVVGINEEAALRNAIANCIPGVGLLTCHRNLCDHAQRALHHISTASTQRMIIRSIFGSEGLTSFTDEVAFETKKGKIRCLIERDCPDFLPYFENNLCPKLEHNRSLIERNPFVTPTWANNNSKSIRFVIKNRVKCKAGPVIELIDHLHDLVQSQYRECERAFLCTGKFSLAQDFQSFKVPAHVWMNMSQDHQKRHLTKFLKKHKPLNANNLPSVDDQLLIQKSTASSTKLGQKKRKRNACTQTTSKKLKFET